MTNHVHCIAEFLPVAGQEQVLFNELNKVATRTLKEETGCISYVVTRQTSHAGATGKSKYTIITIEQFEDKQAFDKHCSATYLTNFLERCITNTETAIVDDFRVRLFN